jgi:hypothetical protein
LVARDDRPDLIHVAVHLLDEFIHGVELQLAADPLQQLNAHGGAIQIVAEVQDVGLEKVGRTPTLIAAGLPSTYPA